VLVGPSSVDSKERATDLVHRALKLLTAHQDVQEKLRSALHSAFKRAHEAKETPTVQEIAKTNEPYLFAVIEEVLRCGNTASANIRTATVDTQIWGYHIPKGTDVFMVRDAPISGQ
jgi:cytochrome P450